MLNFKITEGNTTYTYPSPNGDFIRVMVKTREGTNVFDVEKPRFTLMVVYTDIEHGGTVLRCQGYPNGDQPSWEV